MKNVPRKPSKPVKRPSPKVEVGDIVTFNSPKGGRFLVEEVIEIEGINFAKTVSDGIEYYTPFSKLIIVDKNIAQK